MSGSSQLQTILLPGAPELLAAHAQALPQRDDLCGAFCGSLALSAAGLRERGGEPLDQDAVAIAAGSIVSGTRDPGTLPEGETGRRDYRLQIPTIDDSEVSGTTASGVLDAVAELSDGALETIPYSGPWTAVTLGGIFDLAAACERPVTLIANLATHHLWGGRPSPVQILDHLYEGSEAGPPADWDVGHFVCIVARTRGPAGSIYAVADTYPALGNKGVHLQPEGRLTAAIDRRDKPAGGVIVVVSVDEATVIREGAADLGLHEAIWDNGTVTEAPAG